MTNKSKKNNKDQGIDTNSPSFLIGSAVVVGVMWAALFGTTWQFTPILVAAACAVVVKKASGPEKK